MYIEWRFPIRMEKGERSAYSQEKQQCLENYRPVSLQPICGKILERSIFNEIFSFFIKNGLFTQNQSGLNLEIPVLTNFCLLYMRYTNRSMMCLMLEVSS